MTRASKLLLGTLVLWLLPLPVILLGIGLSGGKAISPAAMSDNLVAFDAALLLQLFAWAYFLFPLFAIFAIARDRPKGSK